MRRSLALSLLLFVCACSSNDPEVKIPKTGLSGPDSTDLVQMVDLDGRYIDSIRIVPEGWEDRAPGQEVTITFEATGLSQVRQFEVAVQLSPLAAFAIESSIFRPQRPFISPFASGIEFADNGILRLGGASLSADSDADQSLGTLTLTTTSQLGSLGDVTVLVTLVSVGPSFSDRDRFEGDELHFGVPLR